MLLFQRLYAGTDILRSQRDRNFRCRCEKLCGSQRREIAAGCVRASEQSRRGWRELTTILGTTRGRKRKTRRTNWTSLKKQTNKSLTIMWWTKDQAEISELQTEQHAVPSAVLASLADQVPRPMEQA
ncbi:PREDICTED: uncharacterized protein LOC105566066 [Vollenhovia emeryi]|uniref:uncharacterized protein LOC105566066 n=1 Tax=Vollenhovia emeryi TaxID=411798 RepID=UPI0005F431AA|nr:PREDICTED: uncharacterized protein LOC105566066 [Vollenhovia emeryi]